MPPKRTADTQSQEEPTRVSSRARTATHRFSPYPEPEQRPKAKKSSAAQSSSSKTAAKGSKKATAPKSKTSSTAKKPFTGKAPSSKQSASKTKKRGAEPANIARKRDAPEDDTDEPPKSKRAKTAAKPAGKAATKPATKTARAPAKPARSPPPRRILPTINFPPTDQLRVFVVGEGETGELGLGVSQNAVGAKRFRYNPYLAPVEKESAGAPNGTTQNAPVQPSNPPVGVVHVAAGSQHVAALTHDNKILTWGVNDEGALGRDTTWDGEEDDDNDTGLNPFEAIPTAVPSECFPENTVFTQLAAGDSCTFALTTEGLVYGWGMFRDNQGPLGFSKEISMARNPVLIPQLSKITSLACGNNHALALDQKGSVFAWGAGQQSQLGRRLVERTRGSGLEPREVGVPKKQIKSIAAGADHSFAIANNGKVYSWGLNNFGQCGISENAGEDNAFVPTPTVVQQLRDYKIAALAGGSHHSLGLTEDGVCLSWGRADGGQTGLDLKALPEEVVSKNDRGEVGLVKEPTSIPGVHAKLVATSSDHSIALSTAGRAFSWGFNGLYQTGLGGEDETIPTPQIIDSQAVRDRTLCGAVTGSQFSVVTSRAEAA